MSFSVIQDFSFFLTDCFIKAKEHSLQKYLPTSMAMQNKPIHSLPKSVSV